MYSLVFIIELKFNSSCRIRLELLGLEIVLSQELPPRCVKKQIFERVVWVKTNEETITLVFVETEFERFIKFCLKIHGLILPVETNNIELLQSDVDWITSVV